MEGKSSRQDSSSLRERILAASGEKRAGLVLKGARVVNVFTGELEEADVAIEAGYIAGVGSYEGETEVDLSGKIICPGFIDGHIHLESSMVRPAEFERAVLPHGTTAVITDPHEIANVAGTEGIDYMLYETENLMLDVFFMLPSCVPAADLEESGAVLRAEDLRAYYENPRVLGLAEMMVKQMTPEQPLPEESTPAAPMKFPLETVVRYQNQALSQLVQKAVPRNYDDSLPGNSKAFLAQLSLPAQLASQQSGVPHHLILAQAALESGWGQRQIRRENGEPSYNLFGVKASGNWKGPVTEITTTEYENGEAKKVKAKFRVYSSYLEALLDYVGLLTRNPRYAAVTTAVSAEQGAQALQDAGYATDPHYARKLTNMIQQMKSISDKVSKTYSMNIDNLF